MEVADKVALITGASAGIGMETARLLWNDGAKLAISARSKDKLDRLAEELPGSEVFAADMEDERAVRELVSKVHAKFGRLDILINNAGRGMDGPLESIDIAKYRKLIELNLIGPLAAMQAAIPIMRKQGGGAIVNISSGTALMYAPRLSGYSATKRALNGLSLTARNELAQDKIVVSVVYPYVTKSDFYQNLVFDGEDRRSADQVVAGRAPADSSAYVAGLIRAVIRSGDAEIFAHDWMKSAMR